jgi:hypothetical protein
MLRRIVFVSTLVLVPALAGADSVALTQAKGCQSAFSKQARSYAKKRESMLLKCVDMLVKCEILLEVDGIGAGSCRTKAKDACTKGIGPTPDSKLSRATASFDSRVGPACLALGVASILGTGSGGLWFGNDTACNGATDVPTLVACVRERIEARADATVADVTPRAGILLDNAGLGAGFPNLPRPPQQTIVIAATGPASGVLVSPGTINLAAGTALRVEGDPATLPCGAEPGSNGRLTITVGSGATAQMRQLKEDYAGAYALFGPFIASGSTPYTIDLKDQSCDGTAVSDDIVVP